MLKVLHAGGIIDGDDRLSVSDPEIHVVDKKITYVGPASTAPPIPSTPEVEHIQLGSATLMPGMIDCHAHPVPYPFEGDPWESRVGEDELRVLDATRVMRDALLTGITTFRDCGAPNDTAFALKTAVEMGILPGPRLVVAGPIICPTGGHGYTLGVEVDGYDGVRQQSRRLFKKGANFLKVIASGGSTPGTVRHHGAFSVDELRAAVDEASQHDTYATAHAHAVEGIRMCLDAGVPMIEHGSFVDLDGEVRVDRELVTRIRDEHVIVCPTVCIHGRWLEQVSEDVPHMSPEDHAVWWHRSEGFKGRLEIVGILYSEGVRVLMGSDGTATQRSYPGGLDDLAYSLALHVQAGIPPIEVIRSTTSLAADAIGLGSVTGRLAVGKEADIIAVDGDPSRDIAAMERVNFVMARGVVAKSPAVMSFRATEK